MAVIIDEFEAVAESSQAQSQAPDKAAARTPSRNHKLRQTQRFAQARTQRIWAH
jgi:hypothetical protein